MNLDFLKKIPLFRNSDFTKREDRLSAFKFLGLGIAIITVILLSVFSGGKESSEGKKGREIERKSAAPERRTPASNIIDIQQGEDKDVLDADSNIKAIEAARQNSRDNPGERLFNSSTPADGADRAVQDALNREKGAGGTYTADTRSRRERQRDQLEAMGISSKDEDGNPEKDIYGTATRPKKTPETETRTTVRRTPASSGISAPKTQYDGDDQIRRVRSSSSEDSGQSSATSQAATPAPSTEQAQPEPVRVKKSGGLSSLDDDWSEDDGISSLDHESQYISSDELRPVKVAFIKEEKLTSGQRVTLRLLEDMLADGVLIQKNTHLSATVSIGERLRLEVSNVEINGRIHAVNCVAYDNDGNEGLYCPQTEQEKSKNTLIQGAESIGQTALNMAVSGLGSVASTAMNTGVRVASDKANRKTATVSSGYTFYLIQVQR